MELEQSGIEGAVDTEGDCGAGEDHLATARKSGGLAGDGGADADEEAWARQGPMLSFQVADSAPVIRLVAVHQRQNRLAISLCACFSETRDSSQLHKC